MTIQSDMALMAAGSYWDARRDLVDEISGQDRSNHAPAPAGWKVLPQYDIAGSGSYLPSYTLGANVENLTLLGNGNTSGTGNALANVLSGNAGNNILAGDHGGDTYQAYRGMGQDRILENDAAPGAMDVLSFDAGSSANQLWMRRIGNDLEVSIIGTADKATVQDWYLGSAHHVEQIRSGDNKVLLDTQVETLVQAMAGFAPPPMEQMDLSAAYAAQLAPVLAANWA